MDNYDYTLMLWHVKYMTDTNRRGTTYYVYDIKSTQTGKASTVEVFHPSHLESVLFNLEH